VRGIILSFAIVLLPAMAFADDDTSQSPKRALPSYDGRGPDPSNTDGAGVWTARIVLSPLYLTSEFLLRRPIGAFVTAIETSAALRTLYDFFAFGPDRKIGFLPVGVLEFGFNPSVGFYGFWNDALVKHNDLRLHYEVWPQDWLYGSITDRFHIDADRTFQLRVEGLHRPDMTFFGLGPTSLQSNLSRYSKSLFDLSGSLDGRYWQSSHVQATLGLRKVDVSPGHYGSDPSIEQEAARVFGAPIPYGFDRGYLAPYNKFLATLDTRHPKRTSGTGVRFAVDSEEGANLEQSPASGWIRYGATGTVFIDLNDRGRVLALKVGALFADPLGNGPIPFTELVSLGGDSWMHGYFPGRLVDRSAAVALLSYSWPIAPKLDATIEVSTGNVFGTHLEDFRPGLLRLSGSLGLSAALGDPPVEFLVGLGTETFEHGAQVDSIRLMIGVPRSF